MNLRNFSVSLIFIGMCLIIVGLAVSDIVREQRQPKLQEPYKGKPPCAYTVYTTLRPIPHIAFPPAPLAM